MTLTGPNGGRRDSRRIALVAKALAFAFCIAADTFVLRTAGAWRQLTDGQFRRGYFENADDGVGIAADGAIHTGMIPTFVMSDAGELVVPPGMTAVAPIQMGMRYEATRTAPLAPYMVFGAEAPIAPIESDFPPSPPEGRLVEARTLALRDGRLVLDTWDPTRPWREDAARLSALRAACATTDGAAPLAVARVDGGLDVRLGRCSLVDPLPANPDRPLILAALAGPEWLTVARLPAWDGEYRLEWPVIPAIVVKVAALWWALGAVSAVAASAVLGVAAVWLPVPAMLTWPMMALIGFAASVVRLAMMGWRRLPRRFRPPAALLALLVVGGAIASRMLEPRESVPIAHSERSSGSACAVIGYSTVKGEGLRGERGGFRSMLNERCAPCVHSTDGMFAGGETLAWARDAYCDSPPSFGADGQVIFLGGVNDDYFWGYLSLPRLFIAGQQGGASWRDNEGPAASASLARIAAQEAALNHLMDCVRARRARFLFLHDFLITDLVAGRSPERRAMLDHRRAAVEAGGGTFIDLSHEFGAEVGVSWFNDYVHLSRLAHARVADLICRRLTGADGAAQGRGS